MEKIRLLILLLAMGFNINISADQAVLKECDVAAQLIEDQDFFDDLGLDLDDITIDDIDEVPEAALTWSDYGRLFVEGLKYQVSKAKRGVVTGAQKTKEHIQEYKERYAAGALITGLAAIGIWYTLSKKKNDGK